MLNMANNPKLRFYRTETSPAILEMILFSNNYSAAESVANDLAEWYKLKYGQALQVEQVSGHRYSDDKSYRLVGYAERNGGINGGFQDSRIYFTVDGHYIYSRHGEVVNGTVIRIRSSDKAKPDALMGYRDKGI